MRKDVFEWNFEKREKDKTRRLSILRLVLSTILALVGLTILVSQIFPVVGSFFRGKLLEAQFNSIAKPLPDSYKQYVQGEFAYYNPGTGYFSDLSNQAEIYAYEQSNVLVNKDYKENMVLTISSVGINSIHISSNVESEDENVYNQYLKKGVAHFKGTPLPGDGGNSFIYGHSAINNFFRSHPNLPETIFTHLEKVDIGDRVEIERDNSVLSYTVRRKKIVEADDFSIFNKSGSKETVTLMTCWPIGIGSKRLVLIAELNEF
jgi:LPXTG-site transpeptidase (sortase) family protein